MSQEREGEGQGWQIKWPLDELAVVMWDIFDDVRRSATDKFYMSQLSRPTENNPVIELVLTNIQLHIIA